MELKDTNPQPGPECRILIYECSRIAFLVLRTFGHFDVRVKAELYQPNQAFTVADTL